MRRASAALPPPAAYPEGIVPGLAAPLPLPPRTPEHFICLRGPCQYYQRWVTAFAAGNPASFWEGREPPKQINHRCAILDVVLTDEHVYECSLWHPREPGENTHEAARRAYHEREKGKGE